MRINGIYINPDNVFSVELIEQPMGSVVCIINLKNECILTQRGTIKSANEEFDVIDETYELMKEDIINSLRVLNAESVFNNFRDNDLKSCGVLKYIQTEFNCINNSHNRRFDTVLLTNTLVKP